MKFALGTLSLAVGTLLAAVGTSAMAEQTIGVQTAAGTAATATARVNVRVIVPKIVILRVGAADATVSEVTMTAALNPAVAGAPDNSLAYTGAIPPVFGTQTIARTNPTGTDGVVAVGAWTNGAGATLSCGLGALAGATDFAVGATTALGVPGTADITVGSVAGATNLQHPGTSLSACDGTTTSAIAPRTALGGSFTYGSTLAWNTLSAGTYGNVVTYTATAP